MAEITTRDNVAFGYSFLSFVWGFGMIVAPAIGGFLSDPASQYPSSPLAQAPILIAFPYVLPSLVSACFAVVAFCAGCAFLPETPAFLARRAMLASALVHHAVDDASDESSSCSSDDADAATDAASVAANPAAASTSASNAKGVDDGVLSSGEVVVPHGSDFPVNCLSSAAPGEPPGLLENVDMPASLAGAVAKERDVVAVVAVEAALSAPDAQAEPVGTDCALPLPDRAPTMREVLSDRTVLLVFGLYAILASVHILYEDLAPVVLQLSPAEGGLGLSSRDIGLVQLFSGTTTIVAQFLVVPRLFKLVGYIRGLRHSMWPMAAFVFFPAVGRLHSHSAAAQWAVLGSTAVFRACLTTTAFTATTLLVNNSSRGRGLGVVTGLSQSVASITRAIVPAAAGSAFSGSLALRPGIGDVALHIVYVAVAVGALLATLLTYALPTWVDETPDFGGAGKPAVVSASGVTPKRQLRVLAARMSAGKAATADAGNVIADDEDERIGIDADSAPLMSPAA